jgi:cytoskeletal protein CcmA (bactofilin family)
MFKNLKASKTKTIDHISRSYLGESLQLEGDLRTAGNVEIAGLINGNVFVSEVTISETGSIVGALKATTAEINGHIKGKIIADSVIIGKGAIIKGDIFFRKTLKTEEGADIDGYIKRASIGKTNIEEDIAIEEIVERTERKKPKIVPVPRHKEAV